MKPETVLTVTLDRCPICRGIFLDKGELEQLLGKELGNTADSLASTHTSDDMDLLPATCPRCQKPMMSLVGGGEIRFEWCDGCEAVFLDRGELASLQLFEGD
jgi:Zn-finger nucleic acid-binding protein